MIGRKQRDHKRFAFLVILIVSGLLIASSCSEKKPDPDDYRSYLGDYSYDSSISAMVYEDFDGEGYGILYREVLDFTGYVTHAPLPVLVFFFSPRLGDNAGTTAQVEQIAEDYHEELIVISVNVTKEANIVRHYSVEGVPEFVILKSGSLHDRFGSMSRGSWSPEELSRWIEDGMR